jgi:hypothetical protein
MPGCLLRKPNGHRALSLLSINRRFIDQVAMPFRYRPVGVRTQIAPLRLSRLTSANCALEQALSLATRQNIERTAETVDAHRRLRP